MSHPRFARKLLSIAVGTLICGAAQAQFSLLDTALPAVPMGDNSAVGVSADGNTVLVSATDPNSGATHFFTWNGGTLTDLMPANPSDWIPTGISYDGSKIVGWTYGGSSMRYDAATQQFTPLQPLAGTNKAYAYGLSGDGSTAVGYSCNGGCPSFTAVAWNGAGVATALPSVVPNQVDSVAYAASQNGSVVVGGVDDGTNAVFAAYWAGGQGYSLSSLPGAYSTAFAVSADGSKVAGYSDQFGGLGHAVLWTVPPSNPSAFTMTDLGVLTPGGQSVAKGISADGNVVVGKATSSATSITGFRWTQASGMQSVSQWLANAGISVPTTSSGQGIVSANATNADGSVVVGDFDDGSQTHPFLARVVPPGSTSGSSVGSGFLPDINVYNAGLLEAGAKAIQAGVNLPNLALFGAHHRSLLDNGLTRTGTNGACAWATADAARYNATDTNMELAEAGVCKDIGSTRLGVGIGQAWARQGWSLGGGAKYQGQYLIAEAARAFDGWEASATGYHGRFDTTLNRRYQNGAAIDTSTGHPDAQSTALRLRADWNDAASLGRFTLSPYAAYTWSETRLDAYTETGGGFPARYGAANWNQDDIRVGVALKAALTPAADLRLGLEGAHRFDDSTSGVNGQALGLWSFDLPGQKVKSDWARVTADVDYRLSPAMALTAGFNAASSGGDASWGITAGLRASF